MYYTISLNEKGECYSMLCSVCNKNAAVIFVNKPSSNGSNEIEGLCYDCAKKRGINPMSALAKQANLTDEQLDDMSKQFESIFKDLSNNLNIAAIDESLLNSDTRLYSSWFYFF